jgi:hypothetical protein
MNSLRALTPVVEGLNLLGELPPVSSPRVSSSPWPPALSKSQGPTGLGVVGALIMGCRKVSVYAVVVRAKSSDSERRIR